MASRMTGAREFRHALRRAPEALRREVLEAIKETVDGVYARGLANIDSMTNRRTGVLRRNYRKSVARKALRGRVGYLSATSQHAAFYARFINDGTVNMPARPFHTQAVEAERDADTARMVRARDHTLGLLAGGGRGNAQSRIERFI